MSHTKGADVLVIGGGGREHTLTWKLSQSPLVQHVYVSPGNAGTEMMTSVSNVDLQINDLPSLVTWCHNQHIDMVVVGPEDPLANGISDSLTAAGIPCFGPTAKAALIEADKSYAKDFMSRHNIPTARYRTFTDCKKAAEFIHSKEFPAVVVKASGLAAGKGVMVTDSVEAACQAVTSILQDHVFGAAGDMVVLEERLYGPEISCLAMSDGKTLRMFPPAQDHKCLLDGDVGLNTGGMGAYCPCELVSSSDLEFIRTDIMQRTVDGMRVDGRQYTGVLYAGIMLTQNGPKVLEYNCRFGDPETQVLLPLLQSDLYTAILKCHQQQLHTVEWSFHSNQHAVAVVTVSGGYPRSYKKGRLITGVDAPCPSNELLVFHAGTRRQDGELVTSGGRVLAVVTMATDLRDCTQRALSEVAKIHFDDMFYRRDIAQQAIKHCMGLTYKQAGVSIANGDQLVRSIQECVASTARPGYMSDLGQFGAKFDPRLAGYTDPLLVSGTDGVGTKLKIAQDCGIHDSIGIDLVAMCVNDILCHAAEPLFFLDYFACGRLEVNTASKVIDGISKGCKLAGCALIGGETAEMPGMYSAGVYDLAGFTVGAVNHSQYLPRINDIAPGDVLIGLPSSGLHSNGMSLVRRLVEMKGLKYETESPFSANQTLGEALLTPTTIYVGSTLSALRSGKVKAAAHITGGGLPGNIMRVLPGDMGAQMDASLWEVLPVFRWIATQGAVKAEEMAATFNCGLGMVLVAEQDVVEEIMQLVGEQGCHVGMVTAWKKGEKRVQIDNLETALSKACSLKEPCLRHVGAEGDYLTGECTARVNGNISSLNSSTTEKGTHTVVDSGDSHQAVQKKVGVLISGTGTNLQALIDDSVGCSRSGRIALVISNQPAASGLQRAQKAGIPVKVINHKDFSSRQEFDEALHAALVEAEIDIVCLAGFMRILTGEFVGRWAGRMLNVHPSLLPSFKGHDAHKQVLAAGVRLSGCTVHFVAEEVDGGAIVVQEAVPVLPHDTVETLAERVKTAEHRAFPTALELVSSGKVQLNSDGKIEWQK